MPNDCWSAAGTSVTTAGDLGGLILAKKPGDSVSVTFVDPQGRHRTVSVTLGVRPLPTP